MGCGAISDTSLVILPRVLAEEDADPHIAACKQSSPRILSDKDAEPFISACKQRPKELREKFELSELLKHDREYLQVIAMPNSETLVLISGFMIAGLVVFDSETMKIKVVFAWSEYLRKEIQQYFVLDKAYYRLEQVNGKWRLVAELHAMPYRTSGYHYLWQFNYGPYSSGSSLRYKIYNDRTLVRKPTDGADATTPGEGKLRDSK
jgi:hypothetical protein